jgi:hypothetical protein
MIEGSGAGTGSVLVTDGSGFRMRNQEAQKTYESRMRNTAFHHQSKYISVVKY